jgi:hypothetical protein
MLAICIQSNAESTQCVELAIGRSQLKSTAGDDAQSAPRRIRGYEHVPQ